MKYLTLFVATVSLSVAPLYAQGNACKALTIRGSYGVTCGGYLSPGPNAPLLPVSILGTCSSTNSAFFTCEAKLSLGGKILDQAMKGLASVNENCTGSIRYTQTITGQPAPDMNIRFLVLDEGKVIKGQPVDDGAVMACTLDRMVGDRAADQNQEAATRKPRSEDARLVPVALNGPQTGSRR